MVKKCLPFKLYIVKGYKSIEASYRAEATEAFALFCQGGERYWCLCSQWAYLCWTACVSQVVTIQFCWSLVWCAGISFMRQVVLYTKLSKTLPMQVLTGGLLLFQIEISKVWILFSYFCIFLVKEKVMIGD